MPLWMPFAAVYILQLREPLKQKRKASDQTNPDSEGTEGAKAKQSA